MGNPFRIHLPLSTIAPGTMQPFPPSESSLNLWRGDRLAGLWGVLVLVLDYLHVCRGTTCKRGSRFLSRAAAPEAHPYAPKELAIKVEL